MFDSTIALVEIIDIVSCRHYQVGGNWTDHKQIPYVQHLQSSNDSPPPEDDTKLELFNLTLEDSGLYSCRVKNQYGGAVATGSINVTLKSSGEQSLATSDWNKVEIK